MAALAAEPELVVVAPGAPAPASALDARPRRLFLGGLLALRAPAAGEPRRDRWAELALFLGILLLAALTPAHTAGGVANAPGMELLTETTGGGLCLYRRWTGIECGGCGLTRGFVQLAHGRAWEAVRLNPLAPLLFGWVAWRVVELVTLLGARQELSIALRPGWKWAYYGTVICGLAGLAVFRLAVHLLT